MAWTLVVADDDAEYRLITRALLRRMPETVRLIGEAADGEAGLTIARRERPDIVIAGVGMPRLDGVELTQRLREELPQTRVILMGSITEANHRILVGDSGADAFVNKQVITSALLPAIRDVMRRPPRRRRPESEDSSEWQR
jgi:DNA-binding NarL/FixJ family response regulator